MITVVICGLSSVVLKQVFETPEAFCVSIYSGQPLLSMLGIMRSAFL